MEPKDVPTTPEPPPPPEPDSPARARGIITLGEQDPSQLDEAAFSSQATLFHASKNPDFHVDEEFDYGADQQAEGMTLGQGLYATSSRERATEYMVHGVSESQDRVFALMPYQARMLDLRQVGDASQNAAMPKEIVAQWVAFAKPQIKARLQKWEGFLPKAIPRQALSRLAVRLDHLTERDDVDLREDILGTWDSQARVATPGSQVADIWNAFCKAQGIDGVIYNEGGEMQFSEVHDTTYVFNNLDKIGTHGDWQRRKTTAEAATADDEARLAAVRDRLKGFDEDEASKSIDQYANAEQMVAARAFFESMGIPIDEDGLVSQDITPEQIDILAKWRKVTMDGSIEMPDEETFYRKTLLAVSLWRQKEGATINYLLGKGVGAEVSIRGQVQGRIKRPTQFTYRSHGDFELYDVDYEHDAQGGNMSGKSPYSESFKAVFGGQEFFPPSKTKGLRDIPEGFLDETAEVVDVGGVEMLVPELELQFLDKWEKAGSHDRPEGTDAEVLARQYDLDRDKVHKYLDRFVIEPSRREIEGLSKYDPQWHLDRVSRQIAFAREQLIEDGISDPTLEQVVSRVNATMQRNIKIQGHDSDTMIGGVRIKLWKDLRPDQIGEGDRIVDQEFVDDIAARMEADKETALSDPARKHAELDNLFLNVDVDNAIDDRHLSRTVDTLPPVQDGYVRWVHTTNPNYVLPIFETGLDYEEYGMIDSTARPVDLSDPDSYYGTDVRFNYPGARTIIFDMPMSVLRQHRDVTKAPGILPAEYIVGVIDGYKPAE